MSAAIIARLFHELNTDDASDALLSLCEIILGKKAARELRWEVDEEGEPLPSELANFIDMVRLVDDGPMAELAAAVVKVFDALEELESATRLLRFQASRTDFVGLK